MVYPLNPAAKYTRDFRRCEDLALPAPEPRRALKTADVGRWGRGPSENVRLDWYFH